jgi:hypothetical protein
MEREGMLEVKCRRAGYGSDHGIELRLGLADIDALIKFGMMRPLENSSMRMMLFSKTFKVRTRRVGHRPRIRYICEAVERRSVLVERRVWGATYPPTAVELVIASGKLALETVMELRDELLEADPELASDEYVISWNVA